MVKNGTPDANQLSGSFQDLSSSNAGHFEWVQLDIQGPSYGHKGKKGTKRVPGRERVNKQWLGQYPRANNITYDNGSEFKVHFAELCEDLRLAQKPTSVKNLQVNNMLECLHAVIGDMLCTSELDISETVTQENIDGFLSSFA